MASHPTENPPVIPGLEIASTSINGPSKQEELRNKAIEAIKNFHREGISYSNIVKAHQFAAPEREELKSLFASAKLPIDDDSMTSLNITGQQPKHVDSLQSIPRIEPFATGGLCQSATTNSSAQPVSNEVGPTPAMNKANSRQEYLARLQAARSKKPIPAANAPEQAAVPPAAPPARMSSSAVQPSAATTTGAPSAPLPYPAISPAIRPAKTELVKQKLEALRKETAAKSLAMSQSRPTSSGQSSYSSAIFTEQDDLLSQNLDDSLNENKENETHKERTRHADKYMQKANQPKAAALARAETAGILAPVEGTISDTDPATEESYDSPVADVLADSTPLHIATSAAVQASLTGSNQPPLTPIPGLFLNPFDSKSSLEHQVREPQVHPQITVPSSPAIAATTNVLPTPPRPAGRPSPFGSTLFSPMGHGGPRPVSTSAPGQPFRSTGHPYGQYWPPTQPEKFVININDSDGESEDDLDVDKNEIGQTETGISISQPNAPSTDHGSTLVPSATMGMQTAQHQSAATSVSQTPALAGTSGASTPSNGVKQKEELAAKKKMEMKMALMKAKLKAKLAINRTQTPSTSKKDGAVLPVAPISQMTLGVSTPSHQTASPQPLSSIVKPSPSVLVEQSSPGSTPTLLSPSAVQIQQKKRQLDGSDEGSEWRKKRRAEIQSGLQASDQDLASNMAKIAELQRQLAQLQEENARRQQAREQLAKELEELGVDTEGMSHEEMQKKKDDIEAAQQAEEQRQSDHQKSPIGNENRQSKVTGETGVQGEQLQATISIFQLCEIAA